MYGDDERGVDAVVEVAEAEAVAGLARLLLLLLLLLLITKKSVALSTIP